MDLPGITQMIGAVGFPIVIALLAAWYIKYLGDKNDKTIERMNEQMLAMSDKQNVQLDKMSDAITEVQKSLAALAYIIEKKEGESNDKKS